MKIGTSLLRILLAVVLLWLPLAPAGVAVAVTDAAPNSFDRLQTHVSYLTENDPAGWRPDVPVHGADVSDQPAREVAGAMAAAQRPALAFGTGGVSAIVAGQYHSCALTAAGGVKCWGENGTGQLGDFTTTTRTAPVDVSGLTSAVSAIAAGGVHSCALTAAGGMKCWGNNVNGQLGDSTATRRTAPVDVSGLDSGVSAIAAGVSHSCALTAAGGVKCWGENFAGQLGDGTTGYRTAPVDVSGLSSGVSAIAAGQHHSCPLTAAVDVQCWGWNDNGQLGDGTTTRRMTPVAVSGLDSGASAIATGGSHSCTLTTVGGVKCWGRNDYGQLGDGTTTQRTAPVDGSGLGSGVSAIAAGNSHSCALTAAGGVKCWGNNASGPLGDGSAGHRAAGSLPVLPASPYGWWMPRVP